MTPVATDNDQIGFNFLSEGVDLRFGPAINQMPIVLRNIKTLSKFIELKLSGIL